MEPQPHQTEHAHETAIADNTRAADGFPKSFELLKDAWSVFRKSFWKLQAFAWLPFLAGLPIGLVVGIVYAGTLSVFGTEPAQRLAELAQNPWYAVLIVAATLVALALMLALLYVAVWYQLAFLKTISNPDIGFKESFRETRSMIFPFAWVAVLSMAVIMGGMTLFVVPGIYLVIVLAFTHFIVLFEGERGLGALGRSYQYVRGDVLRAVKYGLFLMLLSILVFIPVGLLTSGISAVSDRETGRFFADVIETILGPLATAYAYAVYLAFKTKKAAAGTAITDRQKKAFKGLAIFGAVSVVVLVSVAGYFASTIDWKSIEARNGGNLPVQYSDSQ